MSFYNLYWINEMILKCSAPWDFTRGRLTPASIRLNIIIIDTGALTYAILQFIRLKYTAF
jgi:hypothetical protein